MRRNIIYPVASISECLRTAHPGDLFAFDLIGTLIHVGYGMQGRLLPIEEELLNAMSVAVGRGITIVIMVEYPEESRANIFNEIVRARLSAQHILCAPPLIENGQKESTYAEALLNCIEKNNLVSQRIHVFDDQHANLTKFRELSVKFPAPLLLHHFATPAFVDTFTNINTNTIFPPDLKNFEIVNKLGGTTECVFLIEHNQSHQRFVLKIGTSEEALAAEMLTKVVYRALGVPTLCMRFYHTLPPSLAGDLEVPVTHLVQVSTVLDKTKREEIEKIECEIPKHFVAHALVGNNDACKDFNHLIDREQFLSPRAVIIDGGANFLFRFNGERHLTPPATFHELQSYQSDMGDRARFMRDLSPHEIREQALAILRQQQGLMNAVREVASKLPRVAKIANEFVNGLAERLDVLATQYLCVPQSTVKSDKAALKDKRGAGVFVLMRENNQIMVLLAQRKNSVYWEHLSAVCDDTDVTLLDTAARAVKGNTNGCLMFSHEQLSDAPFHDLVFHNSKQLFVSRMYIAFHSAVNIDTLPANSAGYKLFRLVSLSDLIKSVEAKNYNLNAAVDVRTVDKQSIYISPQLIDMLRAPMVSQGLRQLVNTQTMRLPSALSYHRNLLPILGSAQAQLGDGESFLAVAGNSHKPLLLAKQSLYKHDWLREFKQRYPQVTKESWAFRYMPTQQYLAVKFGSVKDILEQGAGVGLHRKVIEKLPVPGDVRNKPDHLAKIYAEMYQAEENLQADEYCLYIKLKPCERFTMDLLTAIESLLKGERWPVLRANHHLFHQLGHINQWIEHFKKNDGHSIDADHPDFAACLMTAYTSIYALHDRVGRETLVPASPEEVLQSILNALQAFHPDISNVEEAYQLYIQFNLDESDVYHQVILRGEYLREFAYLANSDGQVQPWQGSSDVMRLLDAVTSEPTLTPALADFFTQAEVRLLTSRQLRMRINLPNATSDAYHLALDRFARKMVGGFFEKITPADSISGGPLMLSSLEHLSKLNAFADMPELYAYQLYLAIKHNDLPVAKMLYEANPDALLVVLGPHHFQQEDECLSRVYMVESFRDKPLSVLRHVLNLKDKQSILLVFKMIGKRWLDVLAEELSFPRDFNFQFGRGYLADNEIIQLMCKYFILNPSKFVEFSSVYCMAPIKEAVTREVVKHPNCRISLCQLVSFIEDKASRDEFILSHLNRIYSLNEFFNILSQASHDVASRVLREMLLNSDLRPELLRNPQKFLKSLILVTRDLDLIVDVMAEFTLESSMILALRDMLTAASYQRFFLKIHTQFKTWYDFKRCSPVPVTHKLFEFICKECRPHIESHFMNALDYCEILSHFPKAERSTFVVKR